MVSTARSRLVCAIAVAAAMLASHLPVAAQGVTTGTMTGVVKDAQGAVIPGASVTAVHVPSGTTYETVTQGDGHFFVPAVRVGGPYRVSAALSGFTTEVQENITVNLGVATDLDFTLKVAAVAETVTVVGKTDPVFSPSRTGAATAVQREELAALPTVSGRINDMIRASPQYSGGTFGGSFAGQDNRMNNITVDGSYFNNSFGLAGQPGDRSGVAPISLEAIEQVQVSVAPYDVRQGNFVGAGVNTVTRSGSNTFTGSGYYRYHNQSFVGTDAAGQTVNPGTFKTTDAGEWAGGPIVKNKLFFFESFESQQDTRPLTTYVANPGGAAPTGNMTRVLASDLSSLSSYLQQNFNYATGPYQGINKNTPGKPFLVKGDYNLNSSNKLTLRYNQLQSSTDVNLSSSGSLGFGRQTFSNNFLNYANSNYTILENIKSGIAEWNSVITNNLSNNLIAGYTYQDESRGQLSTLFPFVDILQGGSTYTSFGSEPFTPANKLKYGTFQAQDSMTHFSEKHSLTFGGSVEKYHSDNSFYPGIQSAYVYSSLSDFYADANAYLTHTVSPVTPQLFQVRYSNIPGTSVPPYQQLDVWYSGAYAQDEWRPRSNVTVTGGLRMDVAKFGNTAYDNPNVDALTFLDQNGNPVKYNSGGLPKASPLWSPRVGFNWDIFNDQTTQLRGGTGIFTGKPAYVWISNQIGNTGMLSGFTQSTAATVGQYHWNPNSSAYYPATVTGAPATSVDLAVTDPNFQFPQTWRTNVALDRKIPWGMIATGEFIYSSDVNGMAYINANLPAAQTGYTGVDNRPRWTSNRLNNAPGNQIVEAIVLQNEGIGRTYIASGTLTKLLSHGFQAKGGYTFARSENTVDPGSIAAGSWNSNPIVTNSNNPPLGISQFSPQHRVWVSTSYTKQFFKFGQTTFAAFLNSQTNGNASYIFSGDANGDGALNNDLIYIPRNIAEMNFKTLTVKSGGQNYVFTPNQQAQAFETYIEQDSYLNSHRGQYAQRNAVFFPMVTRLDVSLVQDVFHSIKGMRHSGQVRLDIMNFGNLLNHNWGVGEQLIQNRILANPSVDAQGRLAYTMATITQNGQPTLLTHSYQTTAQINAGAVPSDVYIMMLSFRYTFQ